MTSKYSFSLLVVDHNKRARETALAIVAKEDEKQTARGSTSITDPKVTYLFSTFFVLMIFLYLTLYFAFSG